MTDRACGSRRVEPGVDDGHRRADEPDQAEEHDDHARVEPEHGEVRVVALDQPEGAKPDRERDRGEDAKAERARQPRRDDDPDDTDEDPDEQPGEDDQTEAAPERDVADPVAVLGEGPERRRG